MGRRRTDVRLLVSLVLIIPLILIGVNLSPAHAAAITVTTLADGPGNCPGSNCTLRAAITQANASAGSVDTITFSLSGIVTLTAPLPAITDSAGLTIDGTGQTIAISGNQRARILTVNRGGRLTLNALVVINGADVAGGGVNNAGTLDITNTTVAGSQAAGPNGTGGGVYNTGTLAVLGSMFTDNRANDGAALYNDGGTVTITRSIFSANQAANSGAGLYNKASGKVSIRSSTFADNRVTACCGAGVYNAGSLIIIGSTFSGNQAVSGGGFFNTGTTSITNSTFSGNLATSGAGGGGMNLNVLNVVHSTFYANQAAVTGGGIQNERSGVANVSNTIVANSANGDCGGVAWAATSLNNRTNNDCTGNRGAVTNLDSTLADNGGPTQTHALLAGSNAIDQPDAACLAETDQRGFGRPVNKFCDIGAFEFDAVQPTPTQTLTSSPTLTFTATFTPTITLTPSDTPTATPTFTNTPTRTPSLTRTPTNTRTATFTRTPTFTPSQTYTPSQTFTPSDTSTFTNTPTPTIPTSTATRTPSRTLTPSRTFTLTRTPLPTLPPTEAPPEMTAGPTEEKPPISGLLITSVFMPPVISVNGVSTLTFTITNSNADITLTGLTFVDNFTNDLTIAPKPNVTNTCGGRVSVQGVKRIILTNGTLPPFGACQVKVDVTSSIMGVFLNITNPISSTETGERGTAATMLTVGNVPAGSTPIPPATSVPQGAALTATAQVSTAVAQATQNSLPLAPCLAPNGAADPAVRANIPAGVAKGANGAEATVYCGKLTDPAQYGVQDRQVIRAYEISALTVNPVTSVVRFNAPVRICLQSYGAFLYRDATGVPRVVTELPSIGQNGYTCADIPNAGTVILVVGYPTITLGNTDTGSGGCQIVTIALVNLRRDPDSRSAVIAQVPTGTTLGVISRQPDWYQVDYQGSLGWLTAVAARQIGACS